MSAAYCFPCLTKRALADYPVNTMTYPSELTCTAFKDSDPFAGILPWNIEKITSGTRMPTWNIMLFMNCDKDKNLEFKKHMCWYYLP